MDANNSEQIDDTPVDLSTSFTPNNTSILMDYQLTDSVTEHNGGASNRVELNNEGTHPLGSASASSITSIDDYFPFYEFDSFNSNMIQIPAGCPFPPLLETNLTSNEENSLNDLANHSNQIEMLEDIVNNDESSYSSSNTTNSGITPCNSASFMSNLHNASTNRIICPNLSSNGELISNYVTNEEIIATMNINQSSPSVVPDKVNRVIQIDLTSSDESDSQSLGPSDALISYLKRHQPSYNSVVEDEICRAFKEIATEVNDNKSENIMSTTLTSTPSTSSAVNSSSRRAVNDSSKSSHRFTQKQSTSGRNEATTSNRAPSARRVSKERRPRIKRNETSNSTTNAEQVPERKSYAELLQNLNESLGVSSIPTVSYSKKHANNRLTTEAQNAGLIPRVATPSTFPSVSSSRKRAPTDSSKSLHQRRQKQPASEENQTVGSSSLPRHMHKITSSNNRTANERQMPERKSVYSEINRSQGDLSVPSTSYSRNNTPTVGTQSNANPPTSSSVSSWRKRASTDSSKTSYRRPYEQSASKQNRRPFYEPFQFPPRQTHLVLGQSESSISNERFLGFGRVSEERIHFGSPHQPGHMHIDIEVSRHPRTNNSTPDLNEASTSSARDTNTSHPLEEEIVLADFSFQVNNIDSSLERNEGVNHTIRIERTLDPETGHLLWESLKNNPISSNTPTVNINNIFEEETVLADISAQFRNSASEQNQTATNGNRTSNERTNFSELFRQAWDTNSFVSVNAATTSTNRTPIVQTTSGERRISSDLPPHQNVSNERNGASSSNARNVNTRSATEQRDRIIKYLRRTRGLPAVSTQNEPSTSRDRSPVVERGSRLREGAPVLSQRPSRSTNLSSRRNRASQREKTLVQSRLLRATASSSDTSSSDEDYVPPANCPVERIQQIARSFVPYGTRTRREHVNVPFPAANTRNQQINNEVIEIDSSDDMVDLSITPKPPRARNAQNPQASENADTPVVRKIIEIDFRVSVKCTICMESISRKAIASTYCGHLFCHECITNALKVKKECPLCRRSITLNQIHPVFI